MRVIALCASAAIFLAITLILLIAPLPGAVALSVAALVSALTAAAFAAKRPAYGWLWGLWASAAFLLYFIVVTLAYVTAGRPDWHPLLAALIVGGASCVSAGIAARLRTSSAGAAVTTSAGAATS